MDRRAVRAYRRFTHSPNEQWGKFSLLILFSLITLTVFYGQYFVLMQKVAYQVITWGQYGYQKTATLVPKMVLGKEIPYIEARVLPVQKLTLGVVLVLSSLVGFLAQWVKLPLGVKLWLYLFLIFIFFPALYFIFLSQAFPFSVADYQSIYMHCMFYSLLFAGLIFSFAVIFMPGSLWVKWAYLAGLYLYLAAFGMVRYSLFMYLLLQGFYFLMPLFIFLLGPLVDFYLCIVWYSLYCQMQISDKEY